MSEPLFRVGGYYEQNDGDIVELRAGGICPKFLMDGYEGTVPVRAFRRGIFLGWRRMDNGMLGSARLDHEHGSHLIPGELHAVDGAWVPVEAEDQRIADADASVEQIMDALADLHFAAIADANAAMIARDGPTKYQRTCVCGHSFTKGMVHRMDGPCYYEEPKSTALPANPALQRMSDTGSHQFGSMKR